MCGEGNFIGVCRANVALYGVGDDDFCCCVDVLVWLFRCNGGSSVFTLNSYGCEKNCNFLLENIEKRRALKHRLQRPSLSHSGLQKNRMTIQTMPAQMSCDELSVRK